VETERSLFWRCAQLLAQVLVRLLFEVKVEGRRHVPRTGGVLIVSNHQSNLDPVVLAAFLPRPLNFVAKSELFANPLGQWLLRRLNAFPIRQGKGDIGALRETIRRLREGHLLNIFPEGARSPDGRMHPFQKGVSLVIQRARVPVVPAAIAGAYHAWPIHRPIWQPGSIRVRFGPPLKLADLGSADEIVAALEREVHRMLGEMRAAEDDDVTPVATPACAEA
jgi:1-acyl-sn-glycerol-3-phosphate acyltransferase